MTEKKTENPRDVAKRLVSNRQRGPRQGSELLRQYMSDTGIGWPFHDAIVAAIEPLIDEMLVRVEDAEHLAGLIRCFATDPESDS